MAAEMPEKRFPWICTFVVLICIVTIVLIWIRCPWGCVPGGVEIETTHTGKLVVENSETTSWTTINNTFGDNPGDFCNNCYHGVLHQLGGFKSGSYHCETITLYKGGLPIQKNGKNVEIACDGSAGYYFVNIEPAETNPIHLGDDASYLADWGMDEECCGLYAECKANHGSDAVCYKKYDDCAKVEVGKCFGGQCAGTKCVGALCRSPRVLHHDLVVNSTLAFWHADLGYGLTTTHTPKTGGAPPLDHLEFLINDTFHVQAYKFTVSPAAGCQWVPETDFDYTYPEVDEIRVSPADGPPSVVLHSDPPWPTKTGP